MCGRSRSTVPSERVDKTLNGIRVPCGVCGLRPCRCGITLLGWLIFFIPFVFGAVAAVLILAFLPCVL